jgi:hypothetical protein
MSPCCAVANATIKQPATATVSARLGNEDESPPKVADAKHGTNNTKHRFAADMYVTRSISRR